MRRLSERAVTGDVTAPDGQIRPWVLYVEDEKDNFEVLAYRLADQYRILWAETDRRAIELLGEHSETLYAVLMDIQLMGSTMDGIGLTRAIRGLSAPPAKGLPAIPVMSDLPIIFLTGYISRYSREELARAGGNALLGKPVDFRELALALTELGRVRGSERQRSASAE